MINKDVLVAEIERRIKRFREEKDSVSIVKTNTYKGFLSFLNTLEVKEGGISTPNIDDILKEEGLDPYSKEAKIFKEIYYTALDRFINTVDVKEENCIWKIARTTVPEDSTNQIICIKEDGLAVTTIGKIVNGTVKWAYLDDLLNTNNFNVEVKEVDIEKEIEYEYNPVDGLDFEEFRRIAKHFYSLGLAQKGG